MKHSTKNRKAFTLAEAMIAMVILAFATSAVILPFSAGAAMHTEGAKRTLAAKLAGDMLENIRNTDFNHDLILAWYGYYAEPAGTVMDANWQVFSDPVYQRFARVTTCSTAHVGGESLIWATVTVYFDDLEVAAVSSLIGP